MEDNKTNYESTSDDNTSEENEVKIMKTRKASSKYINPYGKQKQVQQQVQQQINSTRLNLPEPNKNTEPKNISNDIRKIIKVTNSTLLLIKGRR